MTDLELISREINNLEELAVEIENQVRELIENSPLIHQPSYPGVISGLPKNEWGPLSDEIKIIQRSAIRNYQKYFSTGLLFIKDFLPDKVPEFSECYEGKENRDIAGVMDYLQLRRSQYKNDKTKIIKNFDSRFEIQRSILLAVPFVAKIKEKNLREIISTDFIEREIEQSEYLFKIKCYRAAGALAGVALEQYLKTLCEKHEIDCKKKDTIEPLVQKLYDNNRIDLSVMKRIQHLASIRDKCAHPSDVEMGEIKELIEGVKRII
jgi:hypothetical protein